jgi:hypothetical protein
MIRFSVLAFGVSGIEPIAGLRLIPNIRSSMTKWLQQCDHARPAGRQAPCWRRFSSRLKAFITGCLAGCRSRCFRRDGGGRMYLQKTLHKRGHRPDLGENAGQKTGTLPWFKGSST